MGAGVNKVFLPLYGEPVLFHTLRAFESCDAVDEVTVAVAPDEVGMARALIEAGGARSKAIRVIAGGERRQDSVLQGLGSLDAACDIVVIHDGARPLIRPDAIGRVVEAAREFGAAILAVPVKDTIKLVRSGDVVGTVDRDALWAAATPQAFRREIIEAGHAAATQLGLAATDDSMLVEKAGATVKVVQGEYDNIKITTPEDLAIAEALLAARKGDRAYLGRVRVGLGFDVHRLVPGRPLFLGGVRVPFELGLEGHSDADVMLHAVADAILGACALGDIGRLFPDDDPACAGISSGVILERARDLSRQAGFAVNNVDVMLLAERPRISGFAPQMREAIARALHVPIDRVSIKATTMEGMGFIGSGEAMACYASCSMTPAAT